MKVDAMLPEKNAKMALCLELATKRIVPSDLLLAGQCGSVVAQPQISGVVACRGRGAEDGVRRPLAS